jgi:uncharacterized membrane protein
VRFVAHYTTFDRALKVAYDDVRHFGAPIPLVAEHLLHTLAELAAVLPAAHRAPLVAQAEAVLHTARAEISNPRDRAGVEEGAARFARQVGTDTAPPPEPAGGR